MRTVYIVAIVAILCMGLLGGIARAGDNSWTALGLYGGYIEALAVDPSNPAVIYAGVNWNGLFRSADGGKTWVCITSGVPELSEVSDIAVDPNNSSNIYVAPHWKTLHRSTDAGLTWTAVGPSDSFAIAVSPVDSSVILSGGGYGILRTQDAGLTWAPVIGPTAVRVIRFAPGAPHIAYVGTYERGVWRSEDAGETWTQVLNGFVSFPYVYSLAVDPFDSQVVYIGTLHGLYRTANGGESWTPIGGGLGGSNVQAVAVDPANQQTIYAAVADGTAGVYRSLDNGGSSWSPMMDGMGSMQAWRLAVDNLTPGSIYAGILGGGIWKYTAVSNSDDFSVSINGGAIFVSQTAVTLTLTAPSGTDEMIVSNDGGFAGVSWEPFATSKPWTITSYGRYVLPRVVYAKFKTSGSISGLYQDDVVLDTTPPTGTIAISNLVLGRGQQAFAVDAAADSPTEVLTETVFLPLVARGWLPGYDLVTLSLSADDDVSGVESMIVCGREDFADCGWEPFVPSRTWWLPESAPATVYAKFRDRAGNVSAPCSSESLR